MLMNARAHVQATFSGPPAGLWNARSLLTDEPSTTTTPTLCSGKILFTTATTNGSIGGKSGADTLCNANKPSGFSGSTFKALIGDVAGGRRACYVSGGDSCYSSTTGRMDWVFTANQTYCSADYTTTLGTADSYALLYPNSALGSATTKYFTGFNIAYGISTANNCSDFSSTGGANATAGMVNGSGQNFYAGGFLSCASAGNILCVEQ